jgi:hypothetical protein
MERKRKRKRVITNQIKKRLRNLYKRVVLIWFPVLFLQVFSSFSVPFHALPSHSCNKATHHDDMLFRCKPLLVKRIMTVNDIQKTRRKILSLWIYRVQKDLWKTLHLAREIVLYRTRSCC